MNRGLKILEAAALKNAVTSERAWFVTATSTREKQTLRFALCKRWPKRVTTNRFSQRIRGFPLQLSSLCDDTVPITKPPLQEQDRGCLSILLGTTLKEEKVELQSNLWRHF